MYVPAVQKEGYAYHTSMPNPYMPFLLHLDAEGIFLDATQPVRHGCWRHFKLLKLQWTKGSGLPFAPSGCNGGSFRWPSSDTQAIYNHQSMSFSKPSPPILLSSLPPSTGITGDPMVILQQKIADSSAQPVSSSHQH